MKRTWHKRAQSLDFGSIETGVALEKWINLWMTMHKLCPIGFPLYMARYYIMAGVRAASHSAMREYYKANIKTFYKKCSKSSPMLLNMGAVMTYIQIQMKIHA